MHFAPAVFEAVARQAAAFSVFRPLWPWLEQLQAQDGRWGNIAALQELAAAADLRTASGRPLRFVPPPADGLGYEARIATCGAVETRPDNWHDLFNALVWLAFPQAKAALSGRHAAVLAAAGDGVSRGAGRDAMTHFDECGIVVASERADLLDLLRDFRWKELFWGRRQEVLAHVDFFVFGHATYEQLLAPFRGLTAKAVLYEVPASWRQQPYPERLAAIDRRLAEELQAGRYLAPRDLQPLPLLGIPGLVPDNDDPAYYDDTWQFRSGRQEKVRAKSAGCV
jgi:hypothetical protein